MSSIRRLKTLQPAEVIPAAQLTGHSGCRLTLIEHTDGLRVRKTSKDSAYNERLQLQCQKQKDFKAEGVVHAPRVLLSGMEKELFFFEMSYIHGQTFASYLNNTTALNLQATAEQLRQLLKVSRSAVDPLVNEKFSAKIVELRGNVPANETRHETFAALESFDWRHCLASPCHGDLTLENILISNHGELYLIDFLDSFHNSWILDLAKILQDLELGWSYRHNSKSSHREIRLELLKDALLDPIAARPDGAELIASVYHALLLNVLRIFPYSPIELHTYLDHALVTTLGRIAQIKGSFDEK